MDRTAFAACALLLAPVALGAGCGAKVPPEPAASAPRVLAELQEASPGPWRRGPAPLIRPASLERSAIEPFAPAALDPAEVDQLHMRMHTPLGPEEATQTEVAAPATTVPEGSADVRIIPPGDAGRDLSPTGPAADETSALPVLVDPTVPAAPSVNPASEPRILDGALPPPTATSERLPTTIPPLPEQRGTLPWASSVASNPEMQAVLQQAEDRLRQGFSLAERGAVFLARAEFVAALELIAQANDLQRETQFYTESLAAGLAALEESRDFVRARPVGKKLDMQRIVSGHRTQILSDEKLDSVSPLVAARRYYTYAQEQLAGAAAGEPRSSIALYGLGKLITASGASNTGERLETTAQAMVLHQAALMADRTNYRAANELGVILARNGDLVHARNLLAHSVRLSPHPSTLRNLSLVHAKLGETQLAEQAMNQSLELERAGHRRVGPPVKWVDPITFAGSAPPSDTTLPPVAKTAPTATPSAEGKEAPVTTARKSGSWFPWSTRR